MQAATVDIDNSRILHNSSGAYYLAAHVCACELPEGAVFLDLRSSNYFALDAQCLPRLRHLIQNWPPSSELSRKERLAGVQDDQLIDALHARGLITSTNSALDFSAISSTPTGDCTPNWTLNATLRATLTMLFRLCWSYAKTSALLRSQRLALLLRQLDRRHATHLSLNLPYHELQSLITLFAKLRVWLYTARDNCLLDSIVLTAVLRRYHLDATLHIGVALMPFSAHAWVQLGHYVLDDSVDHVRGYKPILVV